MIRRIISEYKNVLNALKHCGWTSFHTLMIALFILLVGACITLFCVFSCNMGEYKIWLTFALLSCVIAIIIAVLIGIKFSMPYFMRKMEDDRNRENKILSMIQEEYEQENLSEKTRIGIIEKHAKAIIEEMARDAESRRQLESKQQNYNTIIAEITSELYKASCSAQNPQTLSDQQIVSQLINLLTNNNR